MSNEIHEEFGKYTATVDVSPDECPEDPRRWQDIGEIHVFEDAGSFWKKARELFGGRGKEETRDAKAQAAVNALVAGGVAWSGNTPWVGLERYRHSGDAYAMCRQGNFPDRRWDVSPIVGFWAPPKHRFKGSDIRKARDARKAGDEVLVRKVMSEAVSCAMETWNQYVNGDVWCYGAELFDGDDKIEEQSLCGMYGYEYAMEQAREVVAGWRKAYAGAENPS